jgi:hypothetical protein
VCREQTNVSIAELEVPAVVDINVCALGERNRCSKRWFPRRWYKEKEVNKYTYSLDTPRSALVEEICDLHDTQQRPLASCI